MNQRVDKVPEDFDDYSRFGLRETLRLGEAKVERMFDRPPPHAFGLAERTFTRRTSQIPRCARGRTTVAGLRAWAAEWRQNRDTVGAPFGRQKVAGKEVAGNSQKYAKTAVRLPT